MTFIPIPSDLQKGIEGWIVEQAEKIAFDVPHRIKTSSGIPIEYHDRKLEGGEIEMTLDMTDYDKVVIERYKAEQKAKRARHELGFAHSFEIEFDEHLCTVRFNLDEDGPCDIEIEASGEFSEEDYDIAYDRCVDHIREKYEDYEADKADYRYHEMVDRRLEGAL